MNCNVVDLDQQLLLNNFAFPSLSVVVEGMKLLPSLIALSVLLGTTSHAASEKNIGVGFVLGEPTGLVAELNPKSVNPIDLGVAYGFNHWLQVWGDYTFHYPKFVSHLFKTNSPIDSYVGVGGGFVFEDSAHHSDSFGVLLRVPFGLKYMLPDAPLGFFAEIAPGIILSSDTRGIVQGGIGAHYYF